MSLRRSIGLPLHCSGDMYPYLPLIVPPTVLVARSSALAMPKSSTLTLPSKPTITFAGVTSRWTMLSGVPFLPLRSCAWCRPAAAPPTIITASSSGTVQPRRSDVSRIARAFSPCTYSIAMKYAPSAWSTS